MSLSTRHLPGIKDLPVDDISLILKTAEQFKEVLQRLVKNVPSLRDVTIVNLCYEVSTITSERKSVALIDSILYNERTIRSALDALFDLVARKKLISALLIDRCSSLDYRYNLIISINQLKRSLRKELKCFRKIEMGKLKFTS